MMRHVAIYGLLCVSGFAQDASWAKEYAFAEREPESRLEHLVQRLLPSVVKVHGASGLATIEAYASGVVVSADGWVLTLDLAMIQAGQTRVVLHDGSVHDAVVQPPDDKLGVRMLKIDPAGAKLVPVAPTPRTDWLPGTLLVSMGNSFRLAEFSEKVSATFGVLTARARTGLRYRLRDVDYDGELLITDAANAPGQYGGGLFALNGEWLGLNTRIVESIETNTEVAAAIPTWALAPYIARFVGGGDHPDVASATTAAKPMAVAHGIVLFDHGLRRSPPAYIERVEPNSAAAAAGLQADDLIVRLDDDPVRTCAEFARIIAKREPGQAVRIAFKRGNEVRTCELRLGPALR